MEAKMRKCGTCRERAVCSVVLETYETTLEHDGQPYDLVVHNLPVSRCSQCGETSPGEEAEARLSDALRAAAQVLTPAEIRQYRKGLGLKQTELAELLRLSPSTISRWESGAQIQQRSMDVLLRGFFEVREFRAARSYREIDLNLEPIQVGEF